MQRNSPGRHKAIVNFCGQNGGWVKGESGVMQQCLQTHAGQGAVYALVPAVERGGAVHHRSLLLVGQRGLSGRLTPALARRVLDRLLVPSAQVEGVDLHLGDPLVTALGAESAAFVLVLPPLGNLTNLFYTVHPRRNDRFVAARQPLKALFPEVDFTAFAFTGHALGTLAGLCPDRFSVVRQTLAATWVTRVRLLLDRLPTRGVLIDLPAPDWLTRPPIPGEGRRRLRVDPDDRTTAAEALRLLLASR